ESEGYRSELRAQPEGQDRDGAAVAIERRIHDELVVRRHLPDAERHAIVGLDDPFDTWMRQPSVANENAHPAGVEIGPMRARDVVENERDACAVARAAPPGASERQPRGRRPIDIREFIRLDLTGRPPDPAERADIGGQLLIDVQIYTGTAV